jgi:DNA-binding LytR/AlgR family response regulator
VLRIAVCDDEKIAREDIIRRLNDYSRLRNVDIICDQYETGLAFLQSKIMYNMVMLDFQLNKDIKLSGLSVAQKLRENNNDIAIIFLTNYPKVVFSSFEVDTFRFLVKPLNSQKLYKALDDFLRSLDNDMTLMIRLEGATNVINTNRIIFLEGDGKHCIIHMSQQAQPIKCHETLSSVEQRLPKHHFYRCHRSFIVNLKYIHSYGINEIKLRNGACISISRPKYKSFEDIFLKYSIRYGY